MALICYLCNMFGDLKIYSAPIQGFTDYVWRNTHNELFNSVDTFYTPFMRVVNNEIPYRDIKDILPSNNIAPIRPQVLACGVDQTVMMVNRLKEYGYECVDLNMGCPHPPIAKKKKGSGILSFPDDCGKLFMELSKIQGIEYSIKMRLGYDSDDQWKKILALFDIIRPTEVVMHPRTGKQLYGGNVDYAQFAEFIECCSFPVIYNGDIQDADQILWLKECYNNLSGVMVGRQFLCCPNFLEETQSVEQIRHFHDLLYARYAEKLTGGEHQLLNKMKTLWQYLLPNADRKKRKIIIKSRKLQDYKSAVNQLFDALN